MRDSVDLVGIVLDVDRDQELRLLRSIKVLICDKTFDIPSYAYHGSWPSVGMVVYIDIVPPFNGYRIHDEDRETRNTTLWKQREALRKRRRKNKRKKVLMGKA